ncbi:Zinc/iron permease, fungal/plant [Niveomyces insectorum RCEF 264]|uniref:Zinc/iron permease, fungal/plant n=1 Tax=Niveomyces insectorum RCEF 264 TaxID=1081102 RepID=A0A167RWR4_9HYPO|nr:Zinc/iron permease, fungal/plant [Niveomyces insectorum RCEF 264]
MDKRSQIAILLTQNVVPQQQQHLSSATMSLSFDPHNLDLDTADPRDIACYLASLDKDNGGGSLGLRISAVFVILIASTATTMFPVLATHVERIRMPLYLYLFFRFFGSGVIIATAFIHLLDPAYEEIGPQSCVGMTGGWASFTWPPAIAMASVLLIFLFEFLATWYLKIADKRKNDDDQAFDCPCIEEGVCEPVARGPLGGGTNLEYVAGGGGGGGTGVTARKAGSTKMGATASPRRVAGESESGSDRLDQSYNDDDDGAESVYSINKKAARQSFKEQIAAFLILEFGIIFHSVIIGLNLGVVGDEFTTLYPVMVFHQSFEGLGIGARLSAINFPRKLAYLPWVLALAYGLTTPISIAAGMGLKTSYDSGSHTANVVSGIIDAASAGILIYTGLVEMLAKDFLFDKTIIEHKKRGAFMLVSLFLGTALMSMLGKWA